MDIDRIREAVARLENAKARIDEATAEYQRAEADIRDAAGASESAAQSETAETGGDPLPITPNGLSGHDSFIVGYIDDADPFQGT